MFADLQHKASFFLIFEENMKRQCQFEDSRSVVEYTLQCVAQILHYQRSLRRHVRVSQLEGPKDGGSLQIPYE